MLEIAAAHAELAGRQQAQGDYGAALESLGTALRLAPGLDALWVQFSELIRYFNLRHPIPDPVRELLRRSLEHRAVDPGNLVRPVSSLALSHPQGPFSEPLLARLLEDTLIRDAALERLIVETRRRMLKERLPLPVMLAVAHQCFNAEYVFDETAEELAALPREFRSPHDYAAYAAYRPLSTLDAVERAGIESLARRQIDEPAEEARIRGTIAAVGMGQDSVSARVQAQYEENPYPRWIRTQLAFPQERLATASPRVLVAGCGTGQNAIGTALRFPGSSVLAVDLSLASLAYARRKSAELGLPSIEYRQGDILALGSLEERFDLVECSGVLHHMADPFAGLRVLASLRKPGAPMRIGLYSEAGRRAVVRARELIAARGLQPDAGGIRAARAAIRQHPLLAPVAANEDFYSMSGCRDLLFHVQEQRFTLPEIESMLARLGLRFLSFEFPGGTPSPEAKTLADWHRFEREHPGTFSRMYQFWVA